MKLSVITISLHLLLLCMALSPAAQAQIMGGDNPDTYGMVKTNMRVSYAFSSGSISDHFNARVSYEFLKSRRFTLTANTHYNSLTADFKPSELPAGYDPVAMGMNKTHIYGQVGLSGTFRATLFGKPFMAYGMASTDWGDGRFQRVSGMAMGLVMLRANRDTQFGIGPLVLINSTSRIPAFLVFIYRHRFNEHLAVNLYGGMFGLDYSPTVNDLITIGGDVDVRSFYFRPGHPSLPSRCRYTNTSFRPGVKYRRRLLKNFYAEVQGGVALKMSSRVNGISDTHRYFDIPMPARPFAQVALSYAL